MSTTSTVEVDRNDFWIGLGDVPKCSVSKGTRPDLSFFLTSVHYRKLFTALVAGDSTPSFRRPPLPVELIVYVFRLAEFTVPAPSLTVQVRPEGPFCVCSKGPLVRQIWFYTPPISKRLLGKLAGVRLVTESTHQGWVSNQDSRSWSWWEVGVIRGEEHAQAGILGKYTEDSNMNHRDLHWDEENFNQTRSAEENKRTRSDYPIPVRSYVSHRHDVHEHLRIQTYAISHIVDRYLTLKGRWFTPEHELWLGSSGLHKGIDKRNTQIPNADYGGPLRLGDRLAVFGCAQYWGWECHAKWAKLEFDVFWDPN